MTDALNATAPTTEGNSRSRPSPIVLTTRKMQRFKSAGSAQKFL